MAVICGCMFSGKTTEMLRMLAEYSCDSVMAFKHMVDTRYQADAIVSHGGKAYPATAVARAERIVDCIRDGIEVVAVDEGHFFDLALVDVTRDLAIRGISVIITSLDRDSWGRRFPITEELCIGADEPIVKRAVCARCNAAADRTQRLTPIINGNMVVGPESYEPRCEMCWNPPPESPPE